MIKISHTDGTATWINPRCIVTMKRMATQTLIRLVGDHIINSDLECDVIAAMCINDARQELTWLQTLLNPNPMQGMQGVGIGGVGTSSGSGTWWTNPHGGGLASGGSAQTSGQNQQNAQYQQAKAQANQLARVQQSQSAKEAQLKAAMAVGALSGRNNQK